MNVGEINESEFVSLNLPENGSAGVLSSGSSSQMSVPLASTSSTGLDFLPTNYELNKSSSPGDTTSLNFGDGMFFFSPYSTISITECQH